MDDTQHEHFAAFHFVKNEMLGETADRDATRAQQFGRA
jgi:hypothetical protein